MIFNYILDYIYSKFNQLFSSWNQDTYSRTNWQNYFESVDETVFDETIFGRIFRPKINQNIVYNNNKRVHGIKFQILPLLNGLIRNLSGSYVGKRDDSTMSHESGLLSNLQRSVLT